jgi:hypothetical protein
MRGSSAGMFLPAHCSPAMFLPQSHFDETECGGFNFTAILSEKRVALTLDSIDQ